MVFKSCYRMFFSPETSIQNVFQVKDKIEEIEKKEHFEGNMNKKNIIMSNESRVEEAMKRDRK